MICLFIDIIFFQFFKHMLYFLSMFIRGTSKSLLVNPVSETTQKLFYRLPSFPEYRFIFPCFLVCRLICDSNQHIIDNTLQKFQIQHILLKVKFLFYYGVQLPGINLQTFPLPISFPVIYSCFSTSLLLCLPLWLFQPIPLFVSPMSDKCGQNENLGRDQDHFSVIFLFLGIFLIFSYSTRCVLILTLQAVVPIRLCMFR